MRLSTDGSCRAQLSDDALLTEICAWLWVGAFGQRAPRRDSFGADLQYDVLQKTLAALPFTDLSAFQLRPDAFAKHLTGALGFELVAERQVGTAAKGFDRPLLIFRKKEGQPQGRGSR